MMKLPGISSDKGIAAWVRWSVREKGIVIFLIMALMAIGIFGLTRMNKDEYPTIQIKQGLIAAVYPGATAAEVEDQLAKPLEEFLFSFKEIERETLHSVSKEGICYIYTDLETDFPQERKDEAWSKIKLGLQAKKLTLPPGVLAIVVLDDFGTTSSILIAMESSDKSYSELEDYADELCEKLRLIPDLAKASVLGAQQEEIAVTIDRERLSAYGIEPSQLFLQYQASSLSVPSGSFSTAYTESSIHVNATVGSEREISERIVYADALGNIVRLKDIARIERRMKAPDSFISYNGNPCLVINVEMRPDHDIIAFGEEVEAVLDQFESSLPESVSMSRICDQPKVVQGSVFSFLRDLLISMCVVVLVMLMFFPMRSALIASSGVPVCVAVTISVMYMTGMPLNTVTLAALIVVLGMIVDDSIITMDGYMLHLGMGHKGVDAAASSAKELFMPTFIATLALCLMFFPSELIITGYLGDFVELFPWVILIALMTSLFYAITVVPSLEVRFIGNEAPDKRKNLIVKAQDVFFGFLQRIYEWCLEKCFRHPAVTLLGGVIAIGLGILMFSTLNIQMMPKAARDFFVIELYVDAGNGIEVTRERADSLEKLLLADSRVTSVTSFTGTGAPRFTASYTPILPSPQTAQLIVNTVSSKATEEILMEYTGKYEYMFPDALLRFKQMDYQLMDPIAVSFSSENREELIEPSQKVSAFLRSLSGETQWVHSDIDNYAPSVEVTIDSDEASRLGVSKPLLSLTLAGAFGGEKIASLWEGGRQIPVNIYSEGIDRDMDYDIINGQLVPTLIPGVHVPLRQIADIAPSWQPEMLCRTGGRKTVDIVCDLKYGVSEPAVQRKLQKFIHEEIEPTLPEDVSYSFKGLSSLNERIEPQIAWSFGAACLVLFIFLLIHFRKTSLATLSLVMSLLCLFGASFGLWVFGMDFSITAALGLISLVGIIVRNGILMFEYAEELRERGESVRESALLSGKRRMRPIFLTSCTTALGVLPMILSGDLLWMPMGITICFGTLLSIFLITLIMPVSYWQLFKRADKK